MSKYQRYLELRDKIHGKREPLVIDTPEKAASTGIALGTVTYTLVRPSQPSTAAESDEFAKLEAAYHNDPEGFPKT